MATVGFGAITSFAVLIRIMYFICLTDLIEWYQGKDSDQYLSKAEHVGILHNQV